MRFQKLDFLKGIAISLVVLYHLGTVKYGYLGVDIFLVVAGFFSAISLAKSAYEGRLSYFSFIFKRLVRVLPLVTIVTLIALIVGIPTMLPDDLENLSQSVVATSLFANNILQCITTRNYWDVVNEYKPLMHTWYLGVVFQFYCFVPILFILGNAWNRKKISRTVLCLLFLTTFMSLLLWVADVGEKRFQFYYLPWRFFEFGIGCLLGMLSFAGNIRKLHAFAIEFLGWMLVILPIVPIVPFNPTNRLLFVVIGTAFIVFVGSKRAENICDFCFVKWISALGRSSLSIFLWHQVVLAYMRYCVTSSLTLLTGIAYVSFVGILAWASYRYVEKSRLLTKSAVKTIMVCIVGLVILNICAVTIYLRSGVLYDISELDVCTDDLKPGIHKRYNHKNYRYDRPFSADEKKKVLVIGDSFARDWINVLLESTENSKLDISYAELSNLPKDLDERLLRAEYFFYATGSQVPTQIPEKFILRFFSSKCKKLGKEWLRTHAFLVGTKMFGESQGQAFVRLRLTGDHSQCFQLPKNVIARNNKERQRLTDYGFIDLIGALQKSDGVVPVFSDQKKFISQDCRHLTRGGAVYIAKVLEYRLKEIFL